MINREQVSNELQEIGVPEQEFEQVFNDLFKVALFRLLKTIGVQFSEDETEEKTKEIVQDLIQSNKIDEKEFSEIFESVVQDYKKAMM